ncbi:hypothetical protein P9112_009845 [Eukaryota sp. TZLM1-RC]
MSKAVLDNVMNIYFNTTLQTRDPKSCSLLTLNQVEEDVVKNFEEVERWSSQRQVVEPTFEQEDLQGLFADEIEGICLREQEDDGDDEVLGHDTAGTVRLSGSGLLFEEGTSVVGELSPKQKRVR